MGLTECRIIYNALSEEKKYPAIDCLKNHISKELKIGLRILIERDPEGWFAMYHHGWGTAIRNVLRQKGFGEEYFNINNLDDIYVELVEDAVKEKL
jgi:hypothetical protein